ncbi:hypothetical protein CN934_14890 [Ensifer sp. MMN_5]|nr:hypothetical protein CN934_14890 [Ensifer sp. MMN_5]
MCEQIEIGDLVILTFTRRGSYEGIVLDRSTFPNWPNAVTVEFFDGDQPLVITVPEAAVRLLPA